MCFARFRTFSRFSHLENLGKFPGFSDFSFFILLYWYGMSLKKIDTTLFLKLFYLSLYSKKKCLLAHTMRSQIGAKTVNGLVKIVIFCILFFDWTATSKPALAFSSENSIFTKKSFWCFCFCCCKKGIVNQMKHV